MKINARVLYYAAVATIAISGIVHLMLAPNMLNFNINGAIPFLVGGAAQIFWAVPMIRRWGRPWYFVGIGGTMVLIALWEITRMPGNPITGRGSGANAMGIAIEAAEWAFIGLTAAILVLESRRKKLEKKTSSDTARGKFAITSTLEHTIKSHLIHFVKITQIMRFVND